MWLPNRNTFDERSHFCNFCNHSQLFFLVPIFGRAHCEESRHASFRRHRNTGNSKLRTDTEAVTICTLYVSSLPRQTNSIFFFVLNTRTPVRTGRPLRQPLVTIALMMNIMLSTASIRNNSNYRKWKLDSNIRRNFLFKRHRPHLRITKSIICATVNK